MQQNSTDLRRYAPATERNRQPILTVLKRVLPPTGTVLEVASGTGQHSVYFAPRLKPRRWLTSDCHPELLASIKAWQDGEPSPNLYPPCFLNVCEARWPVENGNSPAHYTAEEREKYPIESIVNINMIHIAPWEACLGLMAGAKRILPRGGILYLYGPFKQGGVHTAASNEAFDLSLRSQNPEWGVRNLETVQEVAADHSLTWLETVPMPANNLSVVFQRD
ncbi:DUF938 domain-containing protein [Spirulina subsalsa FACHB-351]|uniref:DUF938 domain-containing protein n=1 Tax=Spirulina subsalsa FACHB-351 TaxID=234711 RepID=A0ABT3L755_9CYAN|nr:class I SAM-dependent methyltransferase [Spirulina subsalsa]MCW6037348.1 DUF938 domain-containing protein [Spirulina subsalsa FACHB-351]